MSSPNTDVEMQYQRQEATMVPEQQPASNETVEPAPKQRTFLGIRGGGCIFDLCACFICCECCEECCKAVDSCCCC